MDFSAESYRSAALEHLASARVLHDEQRYFLAHYLSGVAVECMLRAYLRRTTSEFDARHDLYQLARQARFFDIVPDSLHVEFGAKFSLINLRWSSNHRYATEAQLYAHLTSLKADFNKKGNRFEINSRTVLNLAHDIVSLGNKKWTLPNT